MAEVFLESPTTMIIVPDGFDPFGPGASEALVWLGSRRILSQVAFGDALLAGDWSLPAVPRTFAIEDEAIANARSEHRSDRNDVWDEWLQQISGRRAES